MKFNVAIAISSGLLLGIVATQAAACGDSTFRTGQAMRYHSFVSRRPAQILIYRPGATEQQQDIYRGLTEAGHKVTVAGDAAALANALSAHSYDVIIASASDLDAIDASLGKPLHEPALMAVVEHSDSSTNASRFTQQVGATDSLNQYLKAVEKTMEMRGS